MTKRRENKTKIMGQEVSGFAERVPALVGRTLLKMGNEVAADLQEKSLLQEGSYAIDAGMGPEVMPLYIGCGRDRKGKPYYYDIRLQQYFYAQETPVPVTSRSHQEEEEKEKEHLSGIRQGKDESGDEGSSSSSSSLTEKGLLKEKKNTKRTPGPFPSRKPSRWRVAQVIDKISKDLQEIHSTVTHSVSMLLERGDSIEETRKKLDDIMDGAASFERQSRCLSCAHRCNSLWPGAGFAFIMRIADRIPMSACCQGDGTCGPYEFVSDDDADDDHGEGYLMEEMVNVSIDPREHHLE